MRTRCSLYNYSKSGFCRVPGTEVLLSSYTFSQETASSQSDFLWGLKTEELGHSTAGFFLGADGVYGGNRSREGALSLIVYLLGLQLCHMPTPIIAIGTSWGPRWLVLSTHFCFPMPQGAFEKCSSLGPFQAKKIRSFGYGTLIFRGKFNLSSRGLE